MREPPQANPTALLIQMLELRGSRGEFAAYMATVREAQWQVVGSSVIQSFPEPVFLLT